jgi:LTXXQ motif family protein
VINGLKTATFALALALAAPSFADDAHHPPGSAAAPQAAPPPQTVPAAGPMQPGMGMMRQGGSMDGMSTMPMMGMMQMMRGGAHIEGRLAFIKAELKITDAQEKAWGDFAGALRHAVKKGGDAPMMMHGMSGIGATTPPQMLEQYEKHLTERLDAVRTVRSALTPFYAVLSAEQKKTLAELHPMLGMM